LVDLFPGSAHVRDFNLERADDQVVWQMAAQRGFVIVSKDDEFHQLSLLYGAPPKLIWLRFGNGSTTHIVERIRARSTAIRAFEADEHATFLVLS